MIHGRHGPVRTAHLEPALPQTGERLRRGDLVDQMEVDVEDRRRARFLRDDVGVPDLLEECSLHKAIRIIVHRPYFRTNR